MSRSRGRTLLTSRSPMRIAPSSSGSRPASIRSAVDLPEPGRPDEHEQLAVADVEVELVDGGDVGALVGAGRLVVRH